MTLKEFFAEARRGRKWAVRLNAWGAPVVRCADGYCPLGAVIPGAGKAPGRVWSAAQLGLPERLTAKIADAADYADDEHRPWLLKQLGIKA